MTDPPPRPCWPDRGGQASMSASRAERLGTDFPLDAHRHRSESDDADPRHDPPPPANSRLRWATQHPVGPRRCHLLLGSSRLTRSRTGLLRASAGRQCGNAGGAGAIPRIDRPRSVAQLGRIPLPGPTRALPHPRHTRPVRLAMVAEEKTSRKGREGRKGRKASKRSVAFFAAFARGFFRSPPEKAIRVVPFLRYVEVKPIQPALLAPGRRHGFPKARQERR